MTESMWNEYQALALDTMRIDDLSVDLTDSVLLQSCYVIDIHVAELTASLNLVDVRELKPVHFVMLGLIGESGELIDLLKKIIFHKQDKDVSEVVDELGDVYWYLVTTASVLGYTMDDVELMEDTTATVLMAIRNALDAVCGLYWIPVEDVLKHNVEKLSERYPDGFEFGGGRDRN